ncbi:uncharacterized protein [Cherax quadricarinatus]|uniref:uncharacterized protein n=1 Tax=Cherax quadricarinatus TaxID=27406 RepID=UPI002378BCA4|nr:uncharacterized protein LOC128700754 [Cherax quadricarinatus]
MADDEEEHDIKKSKKLGKTRLEISGLLHPDELMPRRRKKKTKLRGARENHTKGVPAVESLNCNVVSLVRSKQQLMYGGDEDMSLTCHPEKSPHISSTHYPQSSTTTTTTHYDYPLYHTSAQCPPYFTAAHPPPIGFKSQPSVLDRRPSMYPSPQTCFGAAASSKPQLLGGGYESLHYHTGFNGAHVQDINQKIHSVPQRSSMVDMGQISRCACDAFGAGCSSGRLRSPPLTDVNQRYFRRDIPRAFSSQQKCKLEPPDIHPGCTSSSVGTMHPYTWNDKFEGSTGSFERILINSPGITTDSNDFLPRFEHSDLEYSQLNNGHSLSNFDDSCAAETQRDIFNEFSHSGYVTSLMNDSEAKYGHHSLGLYDTVNRNYSSRPPYALYPSRNSWESDTKKREGMGWQGVTPGPHDALIKITNNHTDYDSTTSGAATNIYMDSTFRHDIRGASNDPMQNESRNDHCLSPELFASQYQTSSAPPASHLRPNFGDTTHESQILFSPKISLIRTEDSYRSGPSSVVRVSTLEGEVVLDPTCWKLAHTFTGLLGRKAPFVSNDLLE